MFSNRIELDVSALALADLLGTEIANGAASVVTLSAEMCLTRTSLPVRLIQTDWAAASPSLPDPDVIWASLRSMKCGFAFVSRSRPLPTSRSRKLFQHRFAPRVRCINSPQHLYC